MKCPNCGYPRAKYEVSRKHLWRQFKAKTSGERIKKSEPRQNHKASCSKCGWQGTIHDEELQETNEVLQQVP